MSIEKDFRVTLKTSMNESGVFESIRILKGRSAIDEELLAKINTVLADTFVPKAPTRTTVAIGDDAEQMVMNELIRLSKTNLDFEVSDTSNLLNHGDMAVTHQGKRICIEVKDYTSALPIKEIEKFNKSLAHIEYDAGILIQMNPCGFARQAGIRTPIDFRIVDMKPVNYLCGGDLSMLYPIINMLIVFLQSHEAIDEGELEKKRKALLEIHEKVIGTRTLIEQQKKLIDRMQDNIDDIIKLSLS